MTWSHLLRVLLSNKSGFTSNSHVNWHNMRYWSVENHYWLWQLNYEQHSTINVFRRKKIVCPFYYDYFLNGKKMYKILLVRELPLGTTGRLEFTKEVIYVLASYSQDTRQILNKDYSNNRIGYIGYLGLKFECVWIFEGDRAKRVFIRYHQLI